MMSREEGNPAVLVFVHLVVIVTITVFAAACNQAPPLSSPSPAPTVPTPVPTTARVSARLIPHPVEGQEECLLCHDEGGPLGVGADHAGRSNETCTACHDVQPMPTHPAGASAAEQGRTIWQEWPGLSCRNCHGDQGDGGFGPALAGTSLDFETFRQRVRSPRSQHMVPVATAPDDPAMEKSGVWIGDDDLRRIYDWLAGK